MPELTMPRLSDTMQEGTLARWLKKPGDRVEKGEIVAEIETDKATMELEAYDAGVLEKILVEEGQTVPIGQPIAVVGSGEAADGAGEQAPERAGEPAAGEAQAAERPDDHEPEEAPPAADPRTQAAPKPGAESTGDVSGGQRRGPEGAAAPPPADRERADRAEQAREPAAERRERAAASSESAGRAAAADESDEVRASPMARAIARDRGIDLHRIHGSGPGGRIIRADVEAAVAGNGRTAAQPPAAARPRADEAPSAGPRPPAAEAPAAEDVEEIPLTSMRRAVARRMVESIQSAPHFYLTSVVDAEALVAFRAELNARLAGDGAGDELKLSLNDLLVKACALALRANPDVNVAFAGDKILRHRRIHIGIAVALEGGLIVPVIRDADQKSLGQIAREAKMLIAKARAGKLTPAEYSGGTFTISNLGMFGIDHFTAVINPPEAAILAVGATTAEPVARDGQVVIRQTLKLTLSIDHRALDGATAARFVQQLKAILEEPLRIVV